MFEERQSLTLLLNWEQKLHFFISESRMADWHDAMSMRTHGQMQPNHNRKLKHRPF